MDSGISVKDIIVNPIEIAIEDLKSRSKHIQVCIDALEKVLPILYPEAHTKPATFEQEKAAAKQASELIPEAARLRSGVVVDAEFPPAPNHVETNLAQPKRRHGSGRIFKKAKSPFWYVGYWDNEQLKQITQTSQTEDYAVAEKFLDRVLADRKVARASKAAKGNGKRVDPESIRDVKRAVAAAEVVRKGDEKCTRCPQRHIFDSHTGANGKCLLCWCPSFVGLEQFGVSK